MKKKYLIPIVGWLIIGLLMADPLNLVKSEPDGIGVWYILTIILLVAITLILSINEWKK